MCVQAGKKCAQQAVQAHSLTSARVQAGVQDHPRPVSPLTSPAHGHTMPMPRQPMAKNATEYRERWKAEVYRAYEK